MQIRDAGESNYRLLYHICNDLGRNDFKLVITSTDAVLMMLVSSLVTKAHAVIIIVLIFCIVGRIEQQ